MRHFIIVFLVTVIVVPIHYASAQTFMCDPLVGLCSNPFGNVDTQVPKNLQVAPPQSYTPPAPTPIKLDPIIIPSSAITNAFSAACVAAPGNCAEQRSAMTQCTQGNGTWTYSYGTGIFDWPVGHCQCGTGQQWLGNSCISTAPVPTVTVTHSGLTSSQVSAILSLLEAFGADASVVANVRTALGQ